MCQSVTFLRAYGVATYWTVSIYNLSSLTEVLQKNVLFLFDV